jgi:UDP:flavonoid glycosyltransferase YjiC (YdhE family)
MRVTILALGSRGDVQPYVALGQGLRSAGHQVRFATFENFEGLVRTHGMAFHPVRGNAEAIIASEAGQALAESGQNIARNFVYSMRSFGALAESYMRDLSADTLWQADVIVNQFPASLFGYDAAQKWRVPHVAAAVMPLTRTGAFPLLFFPPQFASLPGYNRLTYRMAEQMGWQPFRRAINRWRQGELGLPKTPFWGHFRQMARERMPVLNGFSAHVVPRPPDWGEHVHVTGYWFLDDQAWQPPPALSDFLDAGPPPVFVGFGSMPIRDRERVTTVVQQALQRSGQRGVLSAGWGGIAQRALPADLFQIDYVPYAWLFPRMAAVVHHGGSGTTAAGLRAGVPSLVVPFLMDQFYWGRRVFELGVGPQPIPFKQLSVDRLAAAITVAVGDEPMRRRAATLGARIRAEDGVARAVEIVEGYATGG